MYNIIKKDRELRSLFWKLIFSLVLMLLLVASAIFASDIAAIFPSAHAAGNAHDITAISIGCLFPLCLLIITVLAHLISRYRDKKPKMSKKIKKEALINNIKSIIPGIALKIESLIHNGVISSAKYLDAVSVHAERCEQQADPLYSLDRPEPVIYGKSNDGRFEFCSIKVNMQRKFHKPEQKDQEPVIFNLYKDASLAEDINCNVVGMDLNHLNNLFSSNGYGGGLNITNIAKLLSKKVLIDFGSASWPQYFKRISSKATAAIFDFRTTQDTPLVRFEVAREERDFVSGPPANSFKAHPSGQIINRASTNFEVELDEDDIAAGGNPLGANNFAVELD